MKRRAGGRGGLGTATRGLLLLFANLDLAILWCVLDGLKRSLERERERKVGAHYGTTYS